jgi:hypothetical protein
MVRGWALVAALAFAGCNQIAGIADLRTGELGDAAGGDTSEAGGGSDAGQDGLAPPACPSGQVGVAVTVRDSTPGGYTGVSDNDGVLPDTAVGAASSKCVDPGTQLDLRAVPDDSNADHDWGTLCPPGRRCGFTVQAPTASVVDLR